MIITALIIINMGNSYNFGISRDRRFKRHLGSWEYGGSLSIDKYDILYDDFFAFESTVEPTSRSDVIKKSPRDLWFKNPVVLRFFEIENYCNDIKCSKGWENQGPQIETIRVAYI